MIVKYVRERGYKGEDEDPHFTLGKDYIVLGIMYNAHFKSHTIHLPTDSDGDPVVLELECFDFIDESVPEGWVFRKLENGYLDLEPQEFSGDFWEDFHEGDEDKEGGEALKVFQNVVNKIYAFHGMEPFYIPEPPKKEPIKDHEWWKEYTDEGEKE